MGRVQCTEVMLSYSCLNQRTRVLIKWLGLNVAYAFPVYVKSFKKCALHALIHHLQLSIALFVFLFKHSGFLHAQKSGLSLINNQRYDFSPFIALYL